MNKKALVFLYICSFAFLIAIFVFYGSVGKQTPGGESLYVGEKEVQLYHVYERAAQEQYAIELAATLSAKKASTDNFQADFEQEFGEYLKHYSLTLEEYALTYTRNSDTMTIVGVTEKVFEFKGRNYVYTLTPSFSVTIPYKAEQVAEQTSTEESTVFN